MRILTLFSRFGTDKYTDSDVRLRKDLAKSLPGVTRDFLIVDTALPPTYEERDANGIRVIGSSNLHWEFGAWDRALERLGTEIFSYDYVHIVTSALYSGYVDFHGFLSERILETFKGRAAAFGHLEFYNKPVSLYHYRFQAWLRSSYVLAPPSEFRMLKHLVSFRRPEDIFTHDHAHPYRDDAPISEQYRSYIHSWLTGAGTGQGVQWHSRFDLAPENFNFYKGKASAIFNEMLLSCRLKDQGTTLVDLTWLHRQPAELSPTLAFPSWRQQIARRGTGHEGHEALIEVE